MLPPPNNPTLDELTLQKCVDGELSEVERHSLLTKLNQAHSLDHWRNLALSFVENQVLSKAFESEGTQPVPLSKAASHKPIWHRQVQPWVAVAASLMVGALMGVGGHFWLRTDEPFTDQNLAQSEQPAQSLDSAATDTIFPQSTPHGPHSRPNIGGPGSSVPVMNVNLGRRGGSTGRISVPVYSPEHLHPIPPVGPLTNIPEDVQRMLEADGYVLDREHHWCRRQLEDGREVLIPTETVRVQRGMK
ncbi:MAG TPA: hypothetical protein VNQ76_11460 [Planctomicrobium sp.]|nr:hypothetical protein [Planctomicrobium sp.]